VTDSIVWANPGGEQIGEKSESDGFTLSHTLVAGSDVDPIGGLPLDFLVVESPLPVDGADGNQIGADPLLLGAVDDGDWTGDDWTPDAASPAVDAGDPLGAPDPDGSLPDLGAFGGALGAWTP
jgi:hypothetical protein